MLVLRRVRAKKLWSNLLNNLYDQLVSAEKQITYLQSCLRIAATGDVYESDENDLYQQLLSIRAKAYLKMIEFKE